VNLRHPLSKEEEDFQLVRAEPASDRQLTLLRKRALLIGYYGAENLGDELMLASLHRWLAEQGIDVLVVCENAERVKALHGFKVVQNYPFLGQFGWIESLLRGKAIGTFKQIGAADLVLAGGGDIIRDEMGWRTFSYQVEKLVAAILLGKPVYLINVGITEPVTRYGKMILRWLLPRCGLIIVRETRSLELCRELGAGAITVLAPDIVLQLPDFFPVRYEPAPHPYVLIALHGNPNVYRQYDLSPARLELLTQALDNLVEKYQCELHFLACQSGNGVYDDHHLHRQIISRMRHHESSRLLDWTIDPQQISQHFGGSRMVIAMRLHAAILATAFQKPCLLMPYERKVEEFGKQAAITNILDAESLDDFANIKPVIDNAMMESGRTFRTPPGARNWMQIALNELPGLSL
jgi:polysaccharide pyruvyl transferase CsaB